MSARAKRLSFFALSLIILVAGFAYWQSDLTSDPPMHYSGLGQSLSTDPAQYVYHARNKVLFGEFDPFDYPRWTVYQHSLTSLVGYLWFTIAGVSLRQANMVGVILSMAGLLFLLLGVARHHRAWVVPAVAFCFVINVTLLTYGRLSYLENGLIFMAAMVFWVYARWGDRLWGVAVAAGLVALAMLTGKLFGALLLPALILAILSSGRIRKWREIGAAVAAFFLMCLATILVLYGGDLKAAIGYVSEQSVGLWGFPDGLKSPWSFIEHLISYGFENHMFFLDIDLLAFVVVALLLLTWHLSVNRKLSGLPPTIRLAMFWVGFGLLGLMPLNYSPLRYALLIIPAIIVLGLSLIDTTLKAKKTSVTKLGVPAMVILAFTFWLVLFHGIGNIFFLQTFPRPIRMLTWATLPGSIALAFLTKYLLQHHRVRLTKGMLMATFLVLLGLSAVLNVLKINQKLVREHNFNIAEAGHDVQQILGEGAVLSGPYAPVLTVDTDLKAFIHLFGVAKVDSTLFDRYPVTHLAVDVSNWKEAIKNYPVLEGLLPITTYWIRDVDVRLYNISEVFNNPQAREYQETGFEQAVGHFRSERYDSAAYLAFQFYQAHPQAKSAGLLLGEALWKLGRYDDMATLITSLAKQFPTDFNIQLQCGRFLQIYGAMKNDNGLHTLAMKYFKRAVLLNPFKGDHANRLWLETENRIRRGATSGTP